MRLPTVPTVVWTEPLVRPLAWMPTPDVPVMPAPPRTSTVIVPPWVSASMPFGPETRPSTLTVTSPVPVEMALMPAMVLPVMSAVPP